MLGGSPTWRCPEPALHLAPTGGGGGADGCRQRRTGAGLGLSGFAEPGARAATATRQEDTGSRDPQGGAPPDHLASAEHRGNSCQRKHPAERPPWSLRQKIALTCRILAAEGYESALAGQITARGDRPGTYLMLSFGLGFDEARAGNIVLVDDDLNLLEGDGMVNPSNRFHLWIYRHRPNVNAIVHTHPPYCSALSVTGQPLIAAHMDTAMFYDDCAYLPEWPGPPIGDEEGRIIHEALGDKRAILLAHHGQLV